MPHKLKRSRLFTKRTALIINPSSAQNKWMRSRKLRQYLHKKFPGRIFDHAKDKASMIELAKKLSLENDILVGFGGDGTLADIMQGIFEAGREKEVILGIVPFGSGNALRKSLQIPKQVRKAIKVLIKGEPRPIDLIDVGGRVASFVSIGATGKVAHKKSQHKIPGLIGHLLAARIMFTHPREEMDIELFDGIDDKGVPFDKKTFNLRLFDCVVNKTNHFGYSWTVAPKAKIDDGYLDITLFDIRAYSYLLYFPLIYLGHYQKILKHFKTKRIIVRGKNLQAEYNGEALETRDEIEMKVLPKALKVIGPGRMNRAR
jgi:diacylglycerol kinase family enzyme